MYNFETALFYLSKLCLYWDNPDTKTNFSFNPPFEVINNSKLVFSSILVTVNLASNWGLCPTPSNVTLFSSKNKLNSGGRHCWHCLASFRPAQHSAACSQLEPTDHVLSHPTGLPSSVHCPMFLLPNPKQDCPCQTRPNTLYRPRLPVPITLYIAQHGKPIAGPASD